MRTRSKFKISLRIKASISVIVLIIAITSFFNIFFRNQIRKILRSELQHSGTTLAKNLSYENEFNLVRGNDTALKQGVEDALRNENVVYIMFEDVDGNILEYGEKSGTKRYYYDLCLRNALRMRESGKTIESATMLKEKIFHISMPIYLRSVQEAGQPSRRPKKAPAPGESYIGTGELARDAGQIVGWVQLGISQKGLENYIARLEHTNTMIAIGVIILSIVATNLLISFIMGPLKKLVVATEMVSKGDLSFRAKVTSSDEIGELAFSFNQMTETLKNSTEEIEESARTLQKRVDERTEELKYAKEYTDNIIQSTADMLIVMDPESNVRVVNTAATATLGFKDYELKGKPFPSLLSDREAEFIKDPESELSQFLRMGNIKNYEMSLKTQAGEEIPISLSGSSIKNEEGEMIGMVAIARDIRERMKAEAEIRRLGQTVRSAGEGIVITDLEFEISFANDAMQKLYGYTTQELQGKRVFVLRAPSNRPDLWQEIEEHLKKGEGWRGEIIDMTKDGEEFPILMNATPITNEKDQMVAYCFISNDISELRKTQDHLIQAEKMASLGQLVAGVAHEINTPIGIAVTSTTVSQKSLDSIFQMLESEEVDEDEFMEQCSKLKKSNELCLMNLDRAANMITSFKRIAADQTSGEMREFEVNECLSDTIVSLEPKLKPNEIEVEIKGGEGVTVFNSPGSLSQVATNLILNAVIHAYEEKKGGRIEIAVKAVGKNVELRFQDWGKGIPKEAVKKIFDPFVTSARGKGGTGLGLSIVYNIVTRNFQGNVACESEPGKGTTFIIHFPIKLAGAKKKDEEAASS